MLVVIADILYKFPGLNSKNTWLDIDLLEDQRVVSVLVKDYSLLLGVCAAWVLMFILIGLAVQFGHLPPKPFLRWQRSTFLRRKRNALIRELSWFLLIISMITATVVFDWYLLISGHAVLMRKWSLGEEITEWDSTQEFWGRV